MTGAAEGENFREGGREGEARFGIIRLQVVAHYSDYWFYTDVLKTCQVQSQSLILRQQLLLKKSYGDNFAY